MSETRAADGSRVWWREWVKSWIVRRFDGALCGGELHKRYLMQLGMPPECIAFGYNVVDNKFFAGIRNAKWGMRDGGILGTTEDTIEHWGRSEKEQPEVGPKGEGSGNE
jgi:hypothetical protein